MKHTPVQAIELPRLIRPTAANEMPTPQTLATLDKDMNILRINERIWPTLSERQQREILRTQSDEIVVL